MLIKELYGEHTENGTEGQLGCVGCYAYYHFGGLKFNRQRIAKRPCQFSICEQWHRLTNKSCIKVVCILLLYHTSC